MSEEPQPRIETLEAEPISSLVEHVGRSVRRVTPASLSDADIEDMKQEAFLRLLHFRSSLPSDTLNSFRLRKAAYSVFVDLIRSRRKTGESHIEFDLGQQGDSKAITIVANTLSERLVDYFRRHPEELKRIDRRKFEELVAELFDTFGYTVELTKQTRDGGRDVIAICNKVVSVKYLIECKRPDPGGYVGVRPVRELLGVKSDERATKAILATTAYFSPDAMLLFDRHRWELEPRDFSGLLDWIDTYASLKKP